jgi:hypothetical protein
MPPDEWEFRIGDAFPEHDPVARYLSVLAMIHNDWKRGMTAMNASLGKPDGIGVRLYLFRQLVGSAHEATTFLNDARGRFPGVARFVDQLPPVARTPYDKVFATLAQFDAWLGEHRHITFHYPEMRPERYEAGQDPIATALSRAADDRSSATLGPRYSDVRFDFADAVVAEMLGFDLKTDEGLKLFKQLVTSLAEAQWALGEFVRLSVEKYLHDGPAPAALTEAT